MNALLSENVNLGNRDILSPQPCSSKDAYPLERNVFEPISPDRRAEEEKQLLAASDLTLLCDWCPVFFFGDGNCCVAGYLFMDGEYRLFRTNIITKINEDGRFVTDKDDRRYRLEGTWCKTTYDEIAKLEDIKSIDTFPLIFKAGFKNGFPENWTSVIKETINNLLLEDMLDGPKRVEKSKKPLQKSKSAELTKYKQRPFSTKNPSDCSVAEETRNAGSKPHNYTVEIVKEAQQSPVMLSEDVRELHLDRLDSGGPLELMSSLKKTRSGRVVKPPLDNWRGQFLTLEGEHLTVCAGSENDPVYLKRLGLKPKPNEDSGYLSPTKKTPVQKFARRKAFASEKQTFKRKNKKARPRQPLMPVQLSSSDTDSSQTMRASLLKRASMKRVLESVSVSDKSVQMSPPRVPSPCHAATQTTEEESGIAAGISVNSWSQLSHPVPCVSSGPVLDELGHSVPDSSNFRVRRYSPSRYSHSFAPANSWPKMSSTASACLVSRNAFQQPVSPFDNYVPALPRSPVRQQPKMSQAHGSYHVVSQDFFDQTAPFQFDSGVGSLPAMTQSRDSFCCRLNEAPFGKFACHSARQDGRMTTSTPASCCQASKRIVHRPVDRNKNSRLEQLWKMQHEIIATMNVDLDEDSETSFDHA